MPQASGTQGLHSIFEKSVSLTDDKGAFTVGKGTPQEWVELGLRGRPRTELAANFLFPPSLELRRCQYSYKFLETSIGEDSEPPKLPQTPLFSMELSSSYQGRHHRALIFSLAWFPTFCDHLGACQGKY